MVVAVGMVGVAVRNISFSEEPSLFVREVECWKVRLGFVGPDIFDFDGGFVMVAVEEMIWIWRWEMLSG